MIDSFETYRKLGFTTEEVIENGQLFKYYPKEHEHHYLAMQEGGFSNFSAKLLTRFVFQIISENHQYSWVIKI